ncbi:hypothetical protein HXX76_013684 [Chlamydomonas incerta]|uniref:RING-type domain-containing protein n=1 Tax=Chlamydomonas incerta TaxID=51695 RepID=A0A835VU07_CHLIN|nr:hypothetical protein HXX76_013684 [Chlamydomonas incerta]|eukprot:KAG2425474.1 hypothetical protein HXX76_013684 [Chlamydomonas incerta]
MGTIFSRFRTKGKHHASPESCPAPIPHTAQPDAVTTRVASADECFGADTIVRPASGLKYLNPGEPTDDVLFFRDGHWSCGELRSSTLVQFNYCLSSSSAGDVAAALVLDGGQRHAVIRAVLGVQGATYISSSLAQHLGLRVVALGGSGRVSLGRRGPVSLLVEPVRIQLLDTDGGPVATYPAPLVFVMDAAPFDLHIALDVCGGCRLSSAGCRVSPLGAQEPNVALPRLVPRRWREGERRERPQAAPVWVAEDTHDEALALAAARAAARARVAAVAKGRDAGAAAARAVSEVGQRYGEGATGRLPGGPAAVPAGRHSPQPQQQKPEQLKSELDPDREPDMEQHGPGPGVSGPSRACQSYDPARIFVGLPPLPPSLRPARWAEVAATHVPPHDTECVVCAWSLTGAAGLVAGVVGGGGEAGPGESVVQLRCRHTYHELCVRQMLQRSHTAICPLCRAAVG